MDKFVLSETKRQRQAHFATILGAIVTAGSMLFGVLTYQRSAAEHRQAASLSMLQEYLKLSVETSGSCQPAARPTGGRQISVVCDTRVVHRRNDLESGWR